jgi:hypothetical protein
MSKHFFCKHLRVNDLDVFCRGCFKGAAIPSFIFAGIILFSLLAVYYLDYFQFFNFLNPRQGVFVVLSFFCVAIVVFAIKRKLLSVSIPAILMLLATLFCYASLYVFNGSTGSTVFAIAAFLVVCTGIVLVALGFNDAKNYMEKRRNGSTLLVVWSLFLLLVFTAYTGITFVLNTNIISLSEQLRDILTPIDSVLESFARFRAAVTAVLIVCVLLYAFFRAGQQQRNLINANKNDEYSGIITFTSFVEIFSQAVVVGFLSLVADTIIRLILLFSRIVRLAVALILALILAFLFDQASITIQYLWTCSFVYDAGLLSGISGMQYGNTASVSASPLEYPLLLVRLFFSALTLLLFLLIGSRNNSRKLEGNSLVDMLKSRYWPEFTQLKEDWTSVLYSILLSGFALFIGFWLFWLLVLLVRLSPFDVYPAQLGPLFIAGSGFGLTLLVIGFIQETKSAKLSGMFTKIFSDPQ